MEDNTLSRSNYANPLSLFFEKLNAKYTSISMRRFAEYSTIDKDEIRKQGLRALSYAYKYGKACVQCGWTRIDHLWLTSTCDQEDTPLRRVPQKRLIVELEKRCVVCAVCCRLNPPKRPLYEWSKCVKQTPCVECGLCLSGWARFETRSGERNGSTPTNCKQGLPITTMVESQRCMRCKRKFDKRVALATQLNCKRKAAVGSCEMCHITVEELGYAAFDWDHLDQQTKSGNIGGMTMDGAPLRDIRLEIAKCRLLCVRCHLDHTRVQLGYSDAVPRILDALKRAEIRTFNETPLDLCDSDDSVE